MKAQIGAPKKNGWGRTFPHFLAALVATAFLAAACGGSGSKSNQSSLPPSADSLNKRNQLESTKGLTMAGYLYFPKGEAFQGAGQTLRMRLFVVGEKDEKLSPVETMTPTEVGVGGKFVLTKAPDRMADGILGLDRSNGEPWLQAIVPLFDDVLAREETYVVSPETDLAAKVYREWAFQETPGIADGLLCGELVPPMLAWSRLTQDEQAEISAVQDLAEVIMASEKRFAQLARGDNGDPNDSAILSVRGELRAAGARRWLAARRYGYKGGAENLEKYADAEIKYRQARRAAIRKFNNETDGLPVGARWEVSQKARRAFVRDCLTMQPAPEGCPTLGGQLWSEPDIVAIVDDWAAQNEALDRMAGLGPALMSLPEKLDAPPASGDNTWSPMAFIARLLKIEPQNLKTLEKLAQDWDRTFVKDVLSGARPLDQAAGVYRERLRHIRNLVFESWLGLDAIDAVAMESALADKMKGLAASTETQKPDWSAIARQMEEIANFNGKAFQDAEEKLKKKHLEGLPENELAVLFEAGAAILRGTSGADAPLSLTFAADADLDGFSDALEAKLKTNAEDPSSMLEPILSSKLEPPADLDRDGFVDSVESRLGLRADSADSVPNFDREAFCPKGNAGCMAPGDGLDNDGDGLIDEDPCSMNEAADCRSLASGAPSIFKVRGFAFAGEWPAKGARVEAVRRPDADEAVAWTTEPTGRAGQFDLGYLPEGVYFIRAEMAGGNGRAEDAQRFFFGEARPTAMRFERGGADVTVLSAPIQFGSAAAGSCQAGEALEPVNGKCLKECPSGFERAKDAPLCVCAGGLKFNEETKVCEETCPAGMLGDETSCRCPKGAKWAAETQKCECPAGMALDQAGQACQCQPGLWFDRDQNSCLQTCPSPKTPILGQSVCDCPAGSLRDEAQGCRCPDGFRLSADAGACLPECAGGAPYSPGRQSCVAGGCPEGMKAENGICVCEAGAWSDLTLACETECGGGQENDPVGKECVCKFGSTLDVGSGVCLCPEGSSFAIADGLCSLNCPEGYERTGRGLCRSNKPAAQPEQPAPAGGPNPAAGQPVAGAARDGLPDPRNPAGMGPGGSGRPEGQVRPGKGGGQNRVEDASVPPPGIIGFPNGGLPGSQSPGETRAAGEEPAAQVPKNADAADVAGKEKDPTGKAVPAAPAGSSSATGTPEIPTGDLPPVPESATGTVK